MNQGRQRPPLRSGALTLLITAVLICLAVLAVLTFATAHADLTLAERQWSQTELRLQAETEGQRWLAQLDAGGALPADTTQTEGGGWQTLLPIGSEHSLLVRVGAQGGVEQWRLSRQWTPDQSLNLWQG